MGKQRSSFAKLQRDKAKKEKAQERIAAKTGRTEAKAPEPEPKREKTVQELVAGTGAPSPDELLSIVEELTSRLESKKITEEEFEEAKVELFARLG